MCFEITHIELLVFDRNYNREINAYFAVAARTAYKTTVYSLPRDVFTESLPSNNRRIYRDTRSEMCSGAVICT